MAATCTARVDVIVNGLGNEIDKRVRYATTNTPEAVQVGYGTIAAADTYEAVVLGQVAASTIDLLYLKSIDQTIYLYTASVAPASNEAQIVLAASEACLFRPAVSTGVAVSVMVMSGTAEAKYEYIAIGQSS
jgi:hypothetical protein